MAERKKKRWTKTAVEKTKTSKGNTGPPICRLCGSAHWNRDPHKYKKGGIEYDKIKAMK